MKKMKRVAVGILLAVVLMTHSMVLYANEVECEHNWSIYSMEKVYEGQRTDCQIHNACIIYERGYNVINFCTKCGNRRQHHYTEEEHHYLSK